MSSIRKRPNGRWRARYRDLEGREHAKHERTRAAAQEWLDGETAKLVRGDWTAPRNAKTTLREWADTWLAGYAHRASSAAQARSHVNRICLRFGDRPLASIRPSEVREWVEDLRQEGAAPATVRVLRGRLKQLFDAAVEDGIIGKSPMAKKVKTESPEPTVRLCSTAQVWALYDAMPEGMRPAILLGAFAGLRVAEAVALRVVDVDWMRGVIRPTVQYPAEPLKTKSSRTPVPIPHDLVLELNRVPTAHGSATLVVGAQGQPIAPRTLQGAFTSARAAVPGLPEGFRFHDLRHYYASMLIDAGEDVLAVQTRMRHSRASTTLNVYSHRFPDRDESSRAAVSAAFADRLRTDGASGAGSR